MIYITNLIKLGTIWKLNMRTSDRVGLSITFSIGLILVIVGIIRAIYVVQVALKGDVTGTLPLNLFLTLFEQQLAIIVICIPPLRPLWARYRNRSTGYNLDDDGDVSSTVADGSELATFGGSGGKRSKKKSLRGMDDSILNTQLDDRDVNTDPNAVGRYHVNVSDGQSIASGWDSRGDAGSECRLDVNSSLTGPAVRNGGSSGDTRIIEVTTEWTVSRGSKS